MKTLGSKILLALFLLLSFNATAQWEAGLGIGRPMPYSGYKGVIRGGRYLGLEALRHIKYSSWSLQLALDWAKLREDKNKGDEFRQPKLDLISLGAGITYRFEPLEGVEPYAGVSLGATLYNFSHEPTSTTSRTTTNASFSLMPLVGVQYRLTSDVAPFFQLKSILVMDGPPQGFPKASKATGYTAGSLGLRYTF